MHTDINSGLYRTTQESLASTGMLDKYESPVPGAEESILRKELGINFLTTNSADSGALNLQKLTQCAT